MRKIGTVAKTVCTVLLFVICGLFILRCCVAADQSLLNDLTPNRVLASAYNENPALELFTHKTPKEISTDGYMAAYALFIIPEARQVQITVRYNDSIFSYNDLPEDTVFTYTLQSSTGGEVTAVPVDEAERWMYNYKRLVFDGVDFTEETNLTLNIYSGETKITWQLIHHKDQNAVNEPYTLKRADKEALKAVPSEY